MNNNNHHTGWLQNTSPSATLISLGANADSNASGGSMLLVML